MEANQRMPRTLPTIRFQGDEYFVDERLGEFRTETPPIRLIEFIPFDSEKGRRIVKALERRSGPRRPFIVNLSPFGVGLRA